MESPQCECSRVVSVCRGWRMFWNIPRRRGLSEPPWLHPPAPHCRTGHPSTPETPERTDRNRPLARHCPKDSQLWWDAGEKLRFFGVSWGFVYYRLRSVLVIGSLRVTAGCVVVVDWDVLKVAKGKYLSPHLTICTGWCPNITKNILFPPRDFIVIWRCSAISDEQQQ